MMRFVPKRTREQKWRPRRKRLLVLGHEKKTKSRGKRRRKQLERRKKRLDEKRRNGSAKKKKSFASRQKKRNADKLNWQECKVNASARRRNGSSQRERHLVGILTLLVAEVAVNMSPRRNETAVVDLMIAEGDLLTQETAVVVTAGDATKAVSKVAAAGALVVIEAVATETEIAVVAVAAAGMIEIAGTTEAVLLAVAAVHLEAVAPGAPKRAGPS
jgi:hypothetical protein